MALDPAPAIKIEFVKAPDGAVVVVGGWPERTILSDNVVARFTTARNHIVDIKVSNGRGIYRLLKFNAYRKQWLAERVYYEDDF